MIDSTILIPFKDLQYTKKWGYRNLEGTTIIPCMYNSARPFHDGLACVEIGEYFGYIDINSNTQIEPIYDFGSDFKNGLARVGIVKDFRKMVYSHWHFNSDYYYKIKMGYINTEGSQIIPLEYEYITPFVNGYASMNIGGYSYGNGLKKKSAKNNVVGGKWGVLNIYGEIIIPCIYSEPVLYYDGIARICQTNNKYAFIDVQGQAITNRSFDLAYDFRGGAAGVVINEKLGYIDVAGDLIIPCEYDGGGVCSDGVLRVRKKNSYGFINILNEIVLPFKFYKAGDYSSKLFPVKKNSYDTWKLIDINANIIRELPNSIHFISGFKNGIAEFTVLKDDRTLEVINPDTLIYLYHIDSDNNYGCSLYAGFMNFEWNIIIDARIRNRYQILSNDDFAILFPDNLDLQQQYPNEMLPFWEAQSLGYNGFGFYEDNNGRKEIFISEPTMDILKDGIILYGDEYYDCTGKKL